MQRLESLNVDGEPVFLFGNFYGGAIINNESKNKNTRAL